MGGQNIQARVGKFCEWLSHETGRNCRLPSEAEWHPDYTGAPGDGSSWLGDPLTARVCRGGSFERASSEMGPRARDWYNESEAVVGLGFRIVDASIVE